MLPRFIEEMSMQIWFCWNVQRSARFYDTKLSQWSFVCIITWPLPATELGVQKSGSAHTGIWLAPSIPVACAVHSRPRCSSMSCSLWTLTIIPKLTHADTERSSLLQKLYRIHRLLLTCTSNMAQRLNTGAVKVQTWMKEQKATVHITETKSKLFFFLTYFPPSFLPSLLPFL